MLLKSPPENLISRCQITLGYAGEVCMHGQRALGLFCPWSKAEHVPCTNCTETPSPVSDSQSPLLPLVHLGWGFGAQSPASWPARLQTFPAEILHSPHSWVSFLCSDAQHGCLLALPPSLSSSQGPLPTFLTCSSWLPDMTPFKSSESGRSIPDQLFPCHVPVPPSGLPWLTSQLSLWHGGEEKELRTWLL